MYYVERALVHRPYTVLKRTGRHPARDSHQRKAVRRLLAELVDPVVAKQRRKADDVLSRHLRLALDVLEPLEQRHPDYFLRDDESE